LEIQFLSRAKPRDILKRHSVSVTGFYLNRPLSVSLKRLHTHFGFGTIIFRKTMGRKLGTIKQINVLSKNWKSFERKVVFFRPQIPCHGPHGWTPTSNRGFPLASPYHFHVGFVVNEVVLRGSSPRTSVFSCKHHSSNAHTHFCLHDCS